MKRIFLNTVVIVTLVACNSNSTKKADSDSIKTYHEVGVPNVNGNIADTTNAIDLTHQLDTIGKKHKNSAK